MLSSGFQKAVLFDLMVNSCRKCFHSSVVVFLKVETIYPPSKLVLDKANCCFFLFSFCVLAII